MTTLRLFCLATLIIMLTGCSHPVPKTTVEVLDTSLSITPRAEHAAENAILDQISRMGRGDRLILIPITGDAQNDAGGRILRLVAPADREAYDNDLRRFRADAKQRYAAWLASLDPHQMRTDISGHLGCRPAGIRSDSQRCRPPPHHPERFPRRRPFVPIRLVAAACERRACSRVRGRHADGSRIRSPRGPVCLGRLESSDFAPLSPQRKEAVQAFWAEYLSDRGEAPALRFDGTGMLTGNAGCYDDSKDVASTQAGGGEERP